MLYHILRLTWGLLEYLDTGGVEATLHTLALNRDRLVTVDTDTEGGGGEKHFLYKLQSVRGCRTPPGAGDQSGTFVMFLPPLATAAGGCHHYLLIGHTARGSGD